MNKAEYEVYRAGEHWASVVEATTRLVGGRCKRCGADGEDCHHLHYRTLGREIPGVDVILLCRECHETAHCEPTTKRSQCRDCQVKEAQVCDHPSGHWLCLDCLAWRRFTG